MDINRFKDLLYDLINESDAVIDMYEEISNNLLWVVTTDGQVFRIHCEAEDFQLFRVPDKIL